MICNKCMVQMHQKNKIGGGTAEDKKYTTWELKECPVCGRTVVEYYMAVELTEQELKKGDSVDLRVKIDIK